MRDLIPLIGLLPKVLPSQVIFRNGAQFCRGQCYHARCVDFFLEDENPCKAAWAVMLLSKIRVTTTTTSFIPMTINTYSDAKAFAN